MTKEEKTIKVITNYFIPLASELNIKLENNLVFERGEDNLLIVRLDGDIVDYLNLYNYEYCCEFNNKEEFEEYLNEKEIEFDWYSSTVLYIYF